jgi:hypothetical protein
METELVALFEPGFGIFHLLYWCILVFSFHCGMLVVVVACFLCHKFIFFIYIIWPILSWVLWNQRLIQRSFWIPYFFVLTEKKKEASDRTLTRIFHHHCSMFLPMGCATHVFDIFSFFIHPSKKLTSNGLQLQTCFYPSLRTMAKYFNSFCL